MIRAILRSKEFWQIISGLFALSLFGLYANVETRHLFAPVLGVMTCLAALLGILAARRRRMLRPAPLSSPLLSLSPAEFEREVAWILQRMHKGTRCEVTGRASDGGVDVKMWRGGQLAAVVQAKRYATDKVLPPAFVRELDSARRINKAERAILVTTGAFSTETKRLAQRLGIDLIAGAHLERLPSMAARTP
ncbi:MAG: restriction endonuclease [Chloroflexi bacterium CFX4]|nr:restriction endonuclease [Chloroflexi bacterium CFX4]MDL1921971.1 restriction endonuclease [Chloroflexi bacterium CFX3]